MYTIITEGGFSSKFKMVDGGVYVTIIYLLGGIMTDIITQPCCIAFKFTNLPRYVIMYSI